MYFDRFDICEAHYMFAMLWHDGAFSNSHKWRLYHNLTQLEQMGFRPSPCLSNPKDLDTNAREIYRQLVVNHCGIKSTAPTQQ